MEKPIIIQSKRRFKTRNGKLYKNVVHDLYKKFYDEITSSPQLFLQVKKIAGDEYFFDLRNYIIVYILDKCNLTRWLEINLILDKEQEHKDNEQVSLSLRSAELLEKSNIITSSSIKENITCPSVIIREKKYIISGFCSILRFILKYSIHILKEKEKEQDQQQDEIKDNISLLQDLLGFKLSCLSACAEVSTWTKFCEIEIIQAVENTYSDLAKSCKNLELNRDLVRFENHLRQPVSIHNLQKRLETLSISGEIITNLRHDYAVGPDLTLSDLILYPCVELFHQLYGKKIFEEHIPKVDEWYERLTSSSFSIDKTKFHIILGSEIKNNIQIKLNHLTIPNDLPFECLKKNNESTRYNPCWNNKGLKDEAMNFLLPKINIMEIEQREDYSHQIWENIPILCHPEGGNLPVKRRERKCHQLANLAQIVLDIVKVQIKRKISKEDPIKIVDFCSGGGHLGILLAYLLPEAEIILVENKQESNRRAEERTLALGLKNVTFYQCNLDYFNDAHFDIGIALHSCGSSTDLVLNKCISSGAAFVICPCCYGVILENHILDYPRSLAFRKTEISQKHYFIIAHTADQANIDTEDKEFDKKTAQGKLSMRIIDTDRLLQAAQEHNYSTNLYEIIPNTASTRNHILVGIPRSSNSS